LGVQLIRGNGFDIRGPNGNNYFPVNHKLFYVVEIFGPILHSSSWHCVHSYSVEGSWNNW